MLTHPAIDPVAFRLGDIAVHWYGIAYIAGIFAGLWLGRRRATAPAGVKQSPAHFLWHKDAVTDVMFYMVFGIILGGRIGYMVLYDAPALLSEPWRLLLIWQGGMSFHGGVIGVLLALWLFARRRQMPFWTVTDFIAPLIPPGLFFGRLANFINSELWGKPSDVPWAMIPPWGPYAHVPSHPTQLYQALLEGVVLFIILWWFSSKRRPMMAVTGLFAVLYSCFRFFVEFYRLPDPHIGYLAFGWLTMGQLLSLPLLVAGAVLLYSAYRRRT